METPVRPSPDEERPPAPPSDVVVMADPTAELRASELVDRIRWYINMRWIAVLACSLGTAVILPGLVPLRLDPVYFVASTLFLAAANGVYTVCARQLLNGESCGQGVKIFLVVQMVGDFMALSLLAYALGSIEAPILTLFMAHIILSTLFFRRPGSAAIVAVAWLFASLPLILEASGIVPTVSIFDGRFKEAVYLNRLLTSGFIAGIGGVYFICWYLVGVISASLKKREKQLEVAYAMMVSMDREKTQATLRATHELKAPFAAIKSYVYTLRDGYCGELPEKAAKVVARIGIRCDQLTEKITDIIHLSNLKSRIPTRSHLAAVDLVELLTEETAEAALIGEPRDIRVTNHGSATAPAFVVGSKQDLHTLFSNLLRNAVAYSRDRGEVEVFVDAAPKAITVSVVDHGIGIPEGNLTRIFDEHFRSNNAVAHHPDGTGLGLPIVKEIVRLHGASLDVESEVGKGSRFKVSFTPAD